MGEWMEYQSELTMSFKVIGGAKCLHVPEERRGEPPLCIERDRALANRLKRGDHRVQCFQQEICNYAPRHRLISALVVEVATSPESGDDVHSAANGEGRKDGHKFLEHHSQQR